jgi:hypothetical protein
LLGEARAELEQGRVTIAELKDKSPGGATLASDLVWFDRTLANLEQKGAAEPQEAEA